MGQLVRDVMSDSIITVPFYAAVDVAVDLMLNNNVSGVPVVDDQGQLKGLITEYDVLKLHWTCAQTTAIESCEDFMTREVKTVQASATLDVAARIFHAASLRLLLVLEGNQLVGLLSRRDVLRSIRVKRSQPADTTGAAATT